MTRLRSLPTAVVATALFFSGAAHAADAGDNTAFNLFKVLFGLLIVLAMMAASAWLLKRLGVAKAAAGNVVKIIGGVSVGNRERVLVVEVADQWIVVGVAPGRVNSLANMPRQELPQSAVQEQPQPSNFSAWLQQTIDKRNAK